MDSKKLTPITGLWINESKKDKTQYLAGTWEGKKVLVFKNTKKTTEKHPDYNMYLDETITKTTTPVTEVKDFKDINF